MRFERSVVGLVVDCLAFAVWGAFAGCGARVAPAGQDAGSGGPEFGVGDIPDVAPGTLCTNPPLLPFAPRPADVLVLFDRSESMDLALGDRTRYEVAAQILRDLLPAYDDKIRFGFQAFPAKAEKTACSPDFVSGCCAEPPSVAVAPAASAPILAALQAAAPASGNTPTALALQLAGEHFAALVDGVADRYVLLATDGSPSCTLAGKLPPAQLGLAQGTACEEALSQVDKLVAADVRLIVLGIGSDVAADTHGTPSCLEALARRGGLQRADGGPALFLAGDQVAFETALQAIFGAAQRPSCLIDLMNEPTDPMQVRVRLDGHEIPRSHIDGWDYEPRLQARHIKLFGEACTRLQRFQVAELRVEYGCSPCGQGDIICE
jgi:hypothetical protein